MSDIGFINNLDKKESLSFPANIIRGGKLFDEYLNELRLPDGFDKWDKMRRSDYRIQQILRALFTPIKSAEFSYVPKDVNDVEQQKQVAFKNNLFKKWSSKKWDQHLHEILGHLTYGFSIFEPYSKVISDPDFGEIIVLNNLGYIRQNSIVEWDIGKGELKRVRQQINSNNINVSHWLSADELLIFTNEMEGVDYGGISILRGAYGNYVRKDLELKIDMIGIEKMAIGTPIVYAPQSTIKNEEAMSDLENILTNYTSHENAYIIMPEELKNGGFEIKEGKYDARAVDAAVKREDSSMADMVLAGFLDIGKFRSGGNAQSTGQIDLFLNSLLNTGRYIASSLDPLFHSYWALNFGEPKTRLYMQVVGITRDTAEKQMKVIKGYADSKILLPDDRLEGKVREDLNLPEIDTATRRLEVPEVEAEVTENTELSSPIELQDEKLTEAEKNADIKTIIEQFDELEAEYINSIRVNLVKSKNKYLADLKSALKQSNSEAAINSINIGFISQLRQDVADALKKAFLTGKTKAASEVEGAKKLLQDDGVVNRVSSKINFTAKRTAKTIENDFENKASLTAIGFLDEGLTDEQLVTEVANNIDEYIDSEVPYRGVGASTNQYYNVGRNNFFFGNQDLMKGLQYSSIVDNRRTDICRSLHGQIFRPGDVKALKFVPPNHWGCRSFLVVITLSMPDPKFTGLKVKSVGGKSVAEILKEKNI